jgi:hypothetical protein
MFEKECINHSKGMDPQNLLQDEKEELGCSSAWRMPGERGQENCLR